jgi:hypothetical protein
MQRQAIVFRTEDRVEANFEEVAGRAVGEGELTLGEDRLTVFRTTRLVGRQRDAGDTIGSEARKLAVVAYAVIVGIDPDLQLGEGIVACVDLAVTVAIERGQSRNTACKLPAVEIRREDFRAVVDGAVTVDIIGEDAIVAGPGDLILVTGIMSNETQLLAGEKAQQSSRPADRASASRSSNAGRPARLTTDE